MTERDERLEPKPRLEGVEVGHGLTEDERAAHERRVELRQQALTHARSTAEKWAATAAALFAALGFATIAQGGKQIRALTKGYELAVGVGVLTAFGVALVATVMAAIASQGVAPATMTKLTAKELLVYEEHEAERVQRQLNVSRGLLVVGVVLVIASAGFLFFAPTDPGSSSDVVVVDGSRGGANLSGTNLSDASLSGADLRDANLRGIDLSDANLNRASLSESDVSYGNLRGADLRGADLSGADLSYANLSQTNLRGANLSQAILRGAELKGAVVSGADFDGAQGAQLGGARGTPARQP